MIKSLRNFFKSDLAIIILIAILALAVQLFFLNPPILSDQMEYYVTALRLPRLPSNPNIGSMRIGLELPVAFLYRIFAVPKWPITHSPCLVTLCWLRVSI
jgi:hypothetical protein